MSDHATPPDAVAVDDLVVRRGGNLALAGLSARIRPGRVTGVLGPSGSGKTTLMRAILGLQRIASGQVTVLGQPAGTAALRHRIGYMAQERGVYLDLTVEENVRYFARMHGVTRRDADAAIDGVGLGSVADRLVGDLSAGQTSRTSLACALVGRPDLLVLDEPTVGQDPILRQELWARFHALAATGVTLVVSSHDMSEAKRCDDLLLIRAGEVIAAGTPAGLRDRTGAVDLNTAFLRLVRADR